MTRVRDLALPLVLLLTAFAVGLPAPLTSPPARVSLTASASAAVRSGELPARPALDDRMGTALVITLDGPASVTGPALSESYRAGDVVYWERERTVVLFLVDGTAVPGDGLTYLGHVTEGLGALAGCSRDCVVHLGPDGDDAPPDAGH